MPATTNKWQFAFAVSCFTLDRSDSSRWLTRHALIINLHSVQFSFPPTPDVLSFPPCLSVCSPWYTNLFSLEKFMLGDVSLKSRINGNVCDKPAACGSSHSSAVPPPSGTAGLKSLKCGVDQRIHHSCFSLFPILLTTAYAFFDCELCNGGTVMNRLRTDLKLNDRK